MKSAGIRGGHRLCLAVVIGLGMASQAQAIGLGAIEVKSKLGKPFVAEIPITLSTPDEANNLTVRLASPEAFERVGLEPPNDLSANLQFSIGKNARGEPVVRISTPQPMTDPYVSFLMEADWGRGKMVREYTALLDPPRTTAVRRVPIMAPVVRSTPVAPSPTGAIASPMSAPTPTVEIAPANLPDAPAATPIVAASRQPLVAEPMYIPPPIPVPPPPAAMSEPTPMVAGPGMPEPLPAPIASEPAPASVAAAPANISPPEPPPPGPVAPAPEAEATTVSAPAKSDTHTVARGETLSRIASGVHAEVSLNRMMIALQRANPDAFIHQNINLLKSGSVLRIPASEDAQTLSADEANLLVQQQVESWRQISRPQLQSTVEPKTETTTPAVARATRPQSAIAKTRTAKPGADAAAPASKPDNTETAAAKPAVARVSHAHLEIVPPVGSGARDSQTGASAGGSGSELRVQLAQTKEDLAARSAEVGELKSRVADLEKMQQDNQSLLSMKDSKLAAMQKRLADLEKNATAMPASNSSTVASATTTLPDAGAAPPIPVLTTPAAVATPKATADAAPGVAPKPNVAQSTTPTIETPWYERPLVQIGVGLLLLGGLLGIMLRGRRPEETARVSRYGNGSLAASMASARTAAADDDTTTAAEDDFEHHPSEPVVHDTSVHDTSVPAVAPAAAMPASVVRRPYWTGSHDVAQKPPGVDAPAAIDPVDTPIPESKPVADAVAAHDQDEWALDTAPAAAVAATTKQHPATPALENDDQGVATKMELARAYIDIGDAEGARGMLEEVLMEGSHSQRKDALKLLETLD